MAEEEATVNTLREFRIKTPACPLAPDGLDLSWVCLSPQMGSLYLSHVCGQMDFGAVLQT